MWWYGWVNSLWTCNTAPWSINTSFWNEADSATFTRLIMVGDWCWIGFLRLSWTWSQVWGLSTASDLWPAPSWWHPHDSLPQPSLTSDSSRCGTCHHHHHFFHSIEQDHVSLPSWRDEKKVTRTLNYLQESGSVFAVVLRVVDDGGINVLEPVRCLCSREIGCGVAIRIEAVVQWWW